MAQVRITQLANGGYSIQEGTSTIERFVGEFGYDSKSNGSLHLQSRGAIALTGDYEFGEWTVVNSSGTPTTGFADIEAVVDALEDIGAGFRTASGGSGAGFLIPGSATIPFADNAARDTWAAANLDSLIRDTTVVQVTGTPNQWYLWRGETTPATYVNTNWANVTPIIRGEKGDKGDARDASVLVTTLTQDFVPFWNGMAFADSSIQETSTNVVFTKSIIAPDASVDLGSLRLSNAGFNIQLTNLATQEIFYPVGVELLTDGTTQPFYWAFGAETVTAAAADKSETFTGTSIQFITPSVNSGLVNSYTYDSLVNTNDVNIVIRVNSHTDPMPIFDYRRASGEFFNVISGENTLSLPIPLFFEAGTSLYVTIESTNQLQLRGQTILGETVPYLATSGRLGTKTDLSSMLVQSDWNETNPAQPSFIQNKPAIPNARTDEEIRDVVVAMLQAGSNITLIENDAANTLTINSTSGGGGTGPTPSPADLRYGLSSQSDPALVDFPSLTDEPNPTNPITISTGLTTAGQYLHIFSTDIHDIETITDTVLSQIVYQDGGTENIFVKQSNVRTESATTYDSYTVGPFNAGVNEQYIVAFK